MRKVTTCAEVVVNVNVALVPPVQEIASERERGGEALDRRVHVAGAVVSLGAGH